MNVQTGKNRSDHQPWRIASPNHRDYLAVGTGVIVRARPLLGPPRLSACHRHESAGGIPTMNRSTFKPLKALAATSVAVPVIVLAGAPVSARAAISGTAALASSGALASNGAFASNDTSARFAASAHSGPAACQPADLRISVPSAIAGDPAEGMGKRAWNLVFRNIARTACSLRGWPHVVVRTPAGKTVATAISDVKFSNLAPVPDAEIVLRPGQG